MTAIPVSTDEQQARGVMTMVDLVVDVAANRATGGWVLAGAALIVMVEAALSSRKVLWGDIGEEELED
ncbi:MAG: hypothetical protein VX593_03105 [Pseudomonadota bacterium]|nr:hypothetical protein [Pseudomonadota bacterium]